MTPQQWTFLDKSTWPKGEWQEEPDKMQWTDAATGLLCLLVRNNLGALCGYVGVSEGHPLFQMDDSAFYERGIDLDVHGGVNYTSLCQESRPGGRPAEHAICHIPAPGEPDAVWWLGFDCAHSGDHVPCYPFPPGTMPEVYRNVAYVQAECARLAAQLAALSSGDQG